MERNIKRGDIFYISRQPVVGHEVFTGRPGIIVSNDVNNRNSEVVEVVFLTTAPKASLPTHVKILSAKAPSIALCEQITSVSTDRIGDLYGHCTEDEMRQINEAVMCSLNLNNDVVSQSAEERKEATASTREMLLPSILIVTRGILRA